VTQPPHIDGPIWLQLLVTVVFGLAALGAAYSGYFNKSAKGSVAAAEPTSAAILGASIADMGAIRNLSDCVVRLDASIVALTRIIEDQTHYTRNGIELTREECARLRELREVADRIIEIASQRS
jgi:hypothetical protein